MVKVKILGISGSPRHGNTEILVNEVLNSAKKLPGVETEFITLANKQVAGGCVACFNCTKPPYELLCRGPSLKDDVNDILRKMIEADGIILGTPVYWGAPSWKLKCVIDRVQAVECAGMLLRNKIGAAVAVAANKGGGAEGACLDLVKFFLISDMIPASIGPERPIKGVSGYYGVYGQQGVPYRVPSSLPEGHRAVEQDKLALYTARELGKRVVELAKVVKTGLKEVPERELPWPQGPKDIWGEKRLI